MYNAESEVITWIMVTDQSVSDDLLMSHESPILFLRTVDGHIDGTALKNAVIMINRYLLNILKNIRC